MKGIQKIREEQRLYKHEVKKETIILRKKQNYKKENKISQNMQ